jgi:hypothetical protein
MDLKKDIVQAGEEILSRMGENKEEAKILLSKINDNLQKIMSTDDQGERDNCIADNQILFANLAVQGTLSEIDVRRIYRERIVGAIFKLSNVAIMAI